MAVLRGLRTDITLRRRFFSDERLGGSLIGDQNVDQTAAQCSKNNVPLPHTAGYSDNPVPAMRRRYQ